MVNPNIEDFEEAFQEKNDLGFLGQLGGAMGTHMALSKLARFLPGYWKLPPLVISALAGGLWGGISSGLEGKRALEYPGEIAENAMMFASPLAYSAYDAAQEMFKTATGRQTPEEFKQNMLMNVLPGLGLGGYFARKGIKTGDRYSLDPMIYKGFKEAFAENRGQALKDIIKAGGEKTWENLAPERAMIYGYPLPKALERKWGASTLGELFVDPERRVTEAVGTALLARQSVQGNVQESIRQFIDNIENASAQDRYNIIKAFKSDFYMRGVPQGKKMQFWKNMSDEEWNKMMTLMAPIRNMPGKARVKGLINLEEQEDVKMMESVSETMEKAQASTKLDDALFRDLKHKVIDAKTPAEMQTGLLQIMKDPMVEPKMRDMAKALYDFPAKTNYDLVNAWDMATRNMVKERVLMMPDQYMKHADWSILPKSEQEKYAFIDKGEKGFLKDFRGYYLDRNTYHQFLDYADSEKMARGIVETVNRYGMAPWKLLVAVARFPTAIRNSFGNFWLNSVNGKYPIPLSEVEFYLGVLNDMGTRIPGKLGWLSIAKESTIARRLAPKDYVKRFFELAGEDAGTWARTEVDPRTMPRYWREAFKGRRSVGEAFLNLYNTGLSPFTDLYTFSETFAKLAKFKWNLNKGMDEIAAVKDALQSTFNYGSVSKAVKFLRSTFFPFATFNSKIISTLPEAITKNPMILVRWVMVPWMASQMALSAMDINEQEWQNIKRDLPDYIQKGMYFILPCRDAKGRLQMINMSWWLPGLGDLSEMVATGSEPSRWMQHPIFTLAADLRNNKQGATDIPIWHEWEPGIVKVGKALGYILKTFTPTLTPGGGKESIFPGGIDYNLLTEALAGRPNALTMPQAVSSMLGLKTVAIDEGLTKYRREARVK